jgi:pyridoxal phosphate enzyme (YggS family)
MIDIASNYRCVQDHVAEVAHRCGRAPEAITIVCAAKTKGADAIQAALAAGATDIGENYVQEAQQKIAHITAPVHWHLIGHLQRNKARLATQLFTLIHSLDNVPLAQELHRQGQKQGKVVRTLIEVNVGGEVTKSGVEPQELEALLESVSTLSSLRVQGFMAIPPPGPTADASRPYFRILASLRDQYERFRSANIDLKELSMGMTDDYSVAIEEGATIVRIGRAIFGAR